MLPIFLLAFVVSLGLNDGVAEAGTRPRERFMHALSRDPLLASVG